MKLFIAFALSIATTHAQAERTVGNGGGLGEMKAIYLFQKLPTYVEICSRGSCNLDSREFAEFKQLTTTPTSLKIENALATPFETSKHLGAEIRISSQALYDMAGAATLPKPANEIAALLVAAWWSQVSSTSDGQLLVRTQDMLSTLIESDSTAALGANLTIHDLSISWNGNRDHLVALEDPVTTNPISVSPCERFSNWRRAGDTALADVINSCGSTTQYQVLILTLATDARGAVRIVRTDRRTSL